MDDKVIAHTDSEYAGEEFTVTETIFKLKYYQIHENWLESLLD